MITTARDGESFLREAIDSTLAQTDPDWEMIIVDDGSTDGTWDVVCDYDDPRIRGIRKGPVGRAAALNLAVGEATGDYLAILDADDVSVPDRHERQANFLDEHPGVAYVGTRWVPQIDGLGQLLTNCDQCCTTHDEIVGRMRRGKCATEHSTSMLRREIVERIGGYDADLPCGLDHDLFVRMLEHGTVEHLPEPVSLKRIHSGQHYWGPRGIGEVAAERFRYSRHVQTNTARVLGASRLSTYLIPLEYWAKAVIKPVVRPFTRSGRLWRRMQQPSPGR